MICENCIHYDVCLKFAGTRICLCGDKADKRCGMFKQTTDKTDVAPRAEVAREIFEEIEQEINAALQSNYKVLPQIEQSESLWNRINGKIDALRGIDGFVEELKKKYIGGE